MIILQIIFAIILPPVAVALKEGISTHFWINLILTLILWLPGVLHAFWVIFFKPAGP
jgi:uncharacterized membrane protein YqaE (UPF0057 family)